MDKPTTIPEYIQTFPPETQSKLFEILECLRKAAPGAEEALKWGQPALSYQWILFQFAGFKHHVSLYPTPSVITAFENKLTEYKTSTSTVQFPLDKPLPIPLINEIAVYRVRESKEKGIKWM